MVVNNNASAVLLVLTALCKRKEVIVSRGQAVEIGGGFRVPDVMRQSGAKLVEVGTTNCTYVSDYEQAITPRTAALLRVHSSNFKVVGFVQEVAIDDLARLGREKGLPVLDDLGSGCLLDTAGFGLAPEPRVQDSVAAGAALCHVLGRQAAGRAAGRDHRGPGGPGGQTEEAPAGPGGAHRQDQAGGAGRHPGALLERGSGAEGARVADDSHAPGRDRETRPGMGRSALVRWPP